MTALFRVFLKPQQTKPLCIPHNHHFSLPSIIRRTITSSSSSNVLEPKTQKKKPLHLLFQEAVGLREETERPNTETQRETREFNKKLWELEREVRGLKEAESKNRKEGNKDGKRKMKEEKPTRGLYAVFTGKSGDKAEMKREDEGEDRPEVFKEKNKRNVKREERPKVFKELSPEMEMFITHLYKEGYFSNANFLKVGQLDFSCFNDSYGRDFIKHAAEKFGQDHQDIAKWLSGSYLRKVSLFGCPTLMRKSVFSAKRLRKFFEIQEDTVCNKCVLKHSCNFVNQSVWKGDYKTLNLAVVLRVIILYALEAVHPELSVPNEIKASVNQLLHEILKLSQTLNQAA